MRIGIDIGGTKLESAAIYANGDIRVRRRMPRPKSDYAGAIEAVFGLVSSIEHEIGDWRPLGFGIPGMISLATGLVKNAYNPPFNDHPLDRDLAARFSRPVRLMNDANCFALSEAKGGAGAGCHIVFGAILGTGCGSGIMVNGELLTGTNDISGEWGHNPLPWPTTDELRGLECDCAKRGYIETFLSETGFERQHAAFTGNRITAEDIVAQAGSGDAQAEHSLALYENRLARALASIINVIDSEVIVLGGGLSNVARLYENVPKLWSQWIFSDQVDTLLLPPKFGDSSSVRGAAWLWARGE